MGPMMVCSSTTRTTCSDCPVRMIATIPPNSQHIWYPTMATTPRPDEAKKTAKPVMALDHVSNHALEFKTASSVQTSTSANSALSSLNLRRGGTSSPISMSNTGVAPRAPLASYTT